VTINVGATCLSGRESPDLDSRATSRLDLGTLRPLAQHANTVQKFARHAFEPMWQGGGDGASGVVGVPVSWRGGVCWC